MSNVRPLNVAIVFGLLTLLAACVLALCVTRLFIRRLKRGEPKFRSLRAWLRHMLDVMWGLG